MNAHSPEALLRAAFPRPWVNPARRSLPGARVLRVARALSQALASPETAVAIAVGMRKAELELAVLVRRMCRAAGIDWPPNLTVACDPSDSIGWAERRSVYFDETCADGQFDRAVNTLRMRAGLGGAG